MAEPLIPLQLNLLQQRAKENWLIGIDQMQLLNLTQDRYYTLQQLIQATGKSLTLVLAESDPLCFLAGFVAACTAQCSVFLGNPQWTTAEWQQVLQLAQPDLVWGDGVDEWMVELAKFKTQNSKFGSALGELTQAANSPEAKTQNSLSSIMIPTGGSSGRIRFVIHTWETLTASVFGLQQYFQVGQINSCCVLPLHHVSGLMQFIRSFVSRGKLAVFPLKNWEWGIDQIEPDQFFLSLVPTQLQRLLQRDESDRLAQFHTVLLGGAPAWNELLQTSRHKGVRLSPTYGMTETASQVATLKPDAFLQGQTGCGQVLPHAQIVIRDPAGIALPTGQIGTVTIQAKSLMLGYYPECFHSSWFETDDLGFFDAAGYLHIVGRSSQKIITGGENVFAAEVEAAIRSTQLVQDVCVVGIPDSEWGERVAAVYVPVFTTVSITEIQTALSDRLTKFKQPKTWIAVEQLPRNAQGKVNYAQVKQTIMQDYQAVCLDMGQSG